MGRARGSNAVMKAAPETTYGTPPGNGYRQMPFVSSQLGATRGLIESDLLGQGRAPFDPTPDVVNNDGDVVVPVDTMSFGYWLALLLGAPTTAAEGELFAHKFVSGLPALPSKSIEIGFPDVPSYSINYGVRANTLQITSQRSGLLNATIGLIAQGETVDAATSVVTGSAGLANPKRFAQATGSISIDGAVIGSVMTASLSFSNGMEKIETIRGSGEIEDVDPGMPMASGSMTVKFANRDLLNKATSGTPIVLTLPWRDGTSYLAFNFPRVFLPKPKKPITGPAGIQQEFAWQASAGSAALMEVFLTNAVTSYA